MLMVGRAAQADETADRLRHALSLARDGSLDEAVSALPAVSSLERGNLNALQDLAQALRAQRPSVAAHLLAAMRRLEPDATRPRTALESLWAANPSMDGLYTEDLVYYPVDAETIVAGGATIVTISPKAFVNVQPAVDPSDGSTYPGLVSAYVQNGGRLALRFVEHSAPGVDAARARQVVRFLAALSDLTDPILGSTNRAAYPVPVWISTEGAPGARQWRGAIHIEAANAPRSDIEWVRELSHEWGHAALPGVDGFTTPEAWANGDLGERVFLPLMESAGRLTAWSSGTAVAAYSAKYVTPLRDAFSRTGPDLKLLTDKERNGYDHFLGAALYIDGAYGLRVLVDALDGAGGGSSTDFLAAVANVLTTKAHVDVNRGAASGPLPICIPRSGRYTLDGRAVRQNGRPLKSPVTLKAGWAMIEWEGVLSVGRAEAPGARQPSRDR